MADGISVLLVEDNIIAQLAAKSVLLKIGCIVDLASTGKEALEKSKLKQYDVILMDIGLEEGTDGFIVTKQIRQDSLNINTVVIILSAHSEEDYKKEMKETNITQFITKPLDKHQIEDIIHQIQGTEQNINMPDKYHF